jgi:hypothetical protein
LSKKLLNLICFASPKRGGLKEVMKAELILREAKASDIEAISEIALVSLPLDPAWTYRFQFAKDYPKEHKENTREHYDRYFADGRFCIVVAELLYIEDKTITRVIAFAIWQLPTSCLKTIDETKLGMCL